jgi:hypothetical protein
VEFNIAPASVNVSTSAATVMVTARLTDDLAGLLTGEPSAGFLFLAAAEFQSLGGFDAPRATARLRLVSGDRLDMVCQGEVILPQFARTGTWNLTSLAIADGVGNMARFLASDLQAKGFPFAFSVTGIEDATAPEIISLSIEGGVVDTSESGQSITMTSRLRDDLSGLNGGFDAQGRSLPGGSVVAFRSPSGKQSVTGLLQGEKLSGDFLDGVYKATISLPRYSEPGIWRLASVNLVDGAYNTRSIDIGTALAKGLATELTVIGQGDTTPPRLRALDFFPRRIDVSATGQVVTGAIRLTDDVSGFSSMFSVAQAELISPSKTQRASLRFSLLGGMETDATGTMTIPRFSETGVWTLHRLFFSDAVGNQAQLEHFDSTIGISDQAGRGHCALAGDSAAGGNDSGFVAGLGGGFSVGIAGLG